MGGFVRNVRGKGCVRDGGDDYEEVNAGERRCGIETHFVCVGPQGHAKRPGQTEVRKLQVSLLVDQQILRLQVPMQHPVAVTVPYPLHELQRELLDHRLTQPHPLERGRTPIRQLLAPAAVAHGQSLHVLLQVEIQELKDQVELVAVGVDDVEQPHDVGILHLLQQGDLADGGAGDALVLGLEADLLEGDDAARVLQVARFVDDAIGACVCSSGLAMCVWWVCLRSGYATGAGARFRWVWWSRVRRAGLSASPPVIIVQLTLAYLLQLVIILHRDKSQVFTTGKAKRSVVFRTDARGVPNDAGCLTVKTE